MAMYKKKDLFAIYSAYYYSSTVQKLFHTAIISEILNYVLIFSHSSVPALKTCCGLSPMVITT